MNGGHLDDPSETGTDPAYAAGTATGRYPATRLRALWHHAPYFNDGSAATLVEMVGHYDRVLTLRLTEQEKRDLVEYLKSM